MKILFFSDLHGDMKALNKLRKMSADTDVVVCAGDISTMERNLKDIVFQIDKFNKPTLMIHGNHEDPGALKEICEGSRNITFLHKAVHHIDDYVFMGYGGDGFSTNDPAFEKTANNFFKKESAGKRRMIFVTHGPPYGVGIDELGHDPRGNKSYRGFIDEVKPHLAISGHLHENEGRHNKIGRTLFINPGKAGAIVNI